MSIFGELVRRLPQQSSSLIEDAFLRAIDSAPADDGARLKYADWLQEQRGETSRQHAELIRIQCQVARTGPGGAARARREEELLAQVRPGILGPLAAPPALVDQALELRRVDPGFAGDRGHAPRTAVASPG